MTLTVNKNPCTTCPYRKDVPSGVWSEEEYEKLRGYDDPQTAFATFLCHQSSIIGKETACKGWVMVQQDSIAVRLACIKGDLDRQTCFEPTEIELHESGNAAADFGERALKRPGRKALKIIDKMMNTGRFKGNEEDKEP